MSNVSPSDRARFYAWRLRWNASAIRSVGVPQPALLPSGARLRGVALGESIVLGRDLRFYDISTSQARRLTATHVLSRLSYDELRRRFTMARVTKPAR